MLKLQEEINKSIRYQTRLVDKIIKEKAIYTKSIKTIMDILDCLKET